MASMDRILVIFITLLLTISASSTFYPANYLSSDVVSYSNTAKKKPCPVNFAIQNYTTITSECKAPSYPPKRCCNAFLKFACPFAKILNDLSNDCAASLSHYIGSYGYPSGLFANSCRKQAGKSGVKCPKQYN